MRPVVRWGLIMMKISIILLTFQLSLVVDWKPRLNFPYSTPHTSLLSPISAKINQPHPSRLIFFFLFVALFHWPIYMSTGRRYELVFISFIHAPGLPHNHRRNSDHVGFENSYFCTLHIWELRPFYFGEFSLYKPNLLTRPNWICKTTLRWRKFELNFFRGLIAKNTCSWIIQTCSLSFD